MQEECHFEPIKKMCCLVKIGLFILFICLIFTVDMSVNLALKINVNSSVINSALQKTRSQKKFFKKCPLIKKALGKNKRNSLHKNFFEKRFLRTSIIEANEKF